jgi:hypothetical protein
MAAEDNTREKERKIEQKQQQREVELQRGREEEARPTEEEPLFSKSRTGRIVPQLTMESRRPQRFFSTLLQQQKKRQQRHTLPRAQ